MQGNATPLRYLCPFRLTRDARYSFAVARDYDYRSEVFCMAALRAIALMLKQKSILVLLSQVSSLFVICKGISHPDLNAFLCTQSPPNFKSSDSFLQKQVQNLYSFSALASAFLVSSDSSPPCCSSSPVVFLSSKVVVRA